jgi:hypothetical protein
VSPQQSDGEVYNLHRQSYSVVGVSRLDSYALRVGREIESSACGRPLPPTLSNRTAPSVGVGGTLRYAEATPRERTSWGVGGEGISCRGQRILCGCVSRRSRAHTRRRRRKGWSDRGYSPHRLHARTSREKEGYLLRGSPAASNADRSGSS